MKLKQKTYNLKERIQRTEALYGALGEAAYEGNLGAVEVATFYMNAEDSQIEGLEAELESGNETGAWDVIQRYHGVNLVDLGSDQSSDVESAINEYFNKNKEVLTYESLCEMVRLVVESEAENIFIVGGEDDPEPLVLSDGKKVSIVDAGASAASPAEAMELALVYGVLNASRFGSRSISVDKSWHKTTPKNVKKIKPEQFAACVAIGAKIASSGGVLSLIHI